MNNIAQEIFNSVKDRKGQMGICVTYLVDASMNKTNNPYYGRVKKLTTISNARLGVSYTNCVNGKLERMGEQPNYQAGKSTTDFVNDFIQVSKDGTKYYLKVGINSRTTTDSVYYLDGRIATDQEMADIKNHLKKSAPSQRQIAAGIDADEVYRHITPNVENIIHIWQGGTTLYDRSQSQPQAVAV